MKKKIIGKTARKWPGFFLFLSVTLVLSGCDGYYGASGPGYGPYYGPGYAAYPRYGAYPGGVTIQVGDRPYYTRGPGYYVGRSYYVWRPGHWGWRNGQKIWIHGHYVVR